MNATLRNDGHPRFKPSASTRGRFDLARPLLLLVSLLFLRAAVAMTVSDLRCEQRENPLGIDVTQPRLSWTLDSNARNQRQTARQVLVASGEEKLAEGRADLWDSGKVASGDSILIPYAGKRLGSHAPCFWKVRVWDQDGKPSPWSRPARWTMGLLDAGDWRANWIGLDGRDETNFLSGTSWIWHPAEAEPEKSAACGTNWFRRVITLPADRRIKRAVFEYTGDNECRGWINDRDIGARNNFRTVKWNDLTTRLEPGQTYCLGFTGRNTGPNKPAGVVGLLTVEFASGPPLVIPTDARWKVSDREEDGWNKPGFDDASWSAPKVLGPVGMAPWGEVRTAEDRRLPARWLRKEFTVGRKVTRALAYFCGLGSSELWLNGAKVGDAVLSPALAQYDKRVFYVTCDVTKQLRRGANTIGAVLGGGRFCSDRSKVYAGTVNFGWPKMLLHLRLEHTDGSVSEIVSDASWKLTTDGPILTSGEFDGEAYDARKEFAGWSKPGFHDATWRPAQLVSTPAGQLAAQMIEPIRITQTLKPVGVAEPKPGMFVFDMGQNMVGWCRLKVRGPAGTTVQLRHAEALKPNGTLYMANLRGAQVTDTFTLRGGGPEFWQPRFTYHGFRFVEVTGYPGRPELDALEGQVVHDDLPTTGEFTCSNETINRVYRNIVWGMRGNYRSIPTDCPQRDERQGWLGDRSEECKGEAYLFNLAPLYAKWRQDMADAQRPNGSIPDVAPAYWPIYADNVTWPSSAILVPGMLERHFGDTATAARGYASAKLWIEHMLGFVTSYFCL